MTGSEGALIILLRLDYRGGAPAFRKKIQLNHLKEMLLSTQILKENVKKNNKENVKKNIADNKG